MGTLLIDKRAMYTHTHNCKIAGTCFAAALPIANADDISLIRFNVTNVNLKRQMAFELFAVRFMPNFSNNYLSLVKHFSVKKFLKYFHIIFKNICKSY